MELQGLVLPAGWGVFGLRGKSDKGTANLLLHKYCKMTRPLKLALEKLESVQVWEQVYEYLQVFHSFWTFVRMLNNMDFRMNYMTSFVLDSNFNCIFIFQIILKYTYLLVSVTFEPI